MNLGVTQFVDVGFHPPYKSQIMINRVTPRIYVNRKTGRRFVYESVGRLAES